MSADAKAWTEADGSWRALHDGPCSGVNHSETPHGLKSLVQGVEDCMGSALRWEPRVFPDGIGLVGFIA